MYHFIINPRSRSGAGYRIWRQLKPLLAQERISYRAHFTRYAGHAAELARSITEAPSPAEASPFYSGSEASAGEPCTVVVLGGDGTLNEVACGLCLQSRPVLGYIPTGSGNDFAKGLGLPRDPAEALHNILHPAQIRRIDIGLLSCGSSSRRFVGSSGMGFDAAVCQEALTSPLKPLLNRFHLGKLTYVLIALRQLLTLKPSPLALRLDGREKLFFPRAYFFCAMNLPFEGGGFRFTPRACPDDGLLDVCILHSVGKLKILALLPLALFGLHPHFRGVTVRRCQKLQALSSVPLAVHADGESFQRRSRVTFTCLGQKLSVISGNSKGNRKGA